MGEVIRFHRPQTRTKSCQECKFLLNPRKDPAFWQCGVSGLYCHMETVPGPLGRCGKERIFWEARLPTFWQRLGNAIIGRIQRKKS